MIAYRDNYCFDVRTQTMIEQPYTLDELVSHLRYFWQKAEGLDYGQEHEVMRCAADEIERLRTDNIRLEAALHRIENGRCDDSQELARITLEQTMTELQDRPCKWCGAPVSLHDYQELARHCYPIQIKAKGAEIERLELEVKSWRQASDLKAAEIERLRARLDSAITYTCNQNYCPFGGYKITVLPDE